MTGMGMELSGGNYFNMNSTVLTYIQMFNSFKIKIKATSGRISNRIAFSG